MARSTQVFEDQSALELLLEIDGLPEAEVLPHLDLRSLLRLSQTNRAIHGLFERGHCREALLNALMTYLADIIVNKPTGKNITILILLLTNMLSAYPELLTRKIPKVIFEETGQAYFDYSLLQLAYAEYEDELCCDAFEPFFKRVYGEAAKDEIRKQLDEKFLEELEESEEEKQKREMEEKNLLVALLTPAKQAFTNEQFNNGWDADGKLILSPATHTHISTSREAFDALQPKEIHKGRRFPLNTAQIIYDDLAQADQQWQFDYNRYALYDDALVSHMQRYMPQNVASGGAQGLHYLRSEVFARDTTLRFDAATSKDGNVAGPRINFYGCLRQPSLDFSGLVGSSVNIVGARRRFGEAWRGAGWRFAGAAVAGIFSKHLSNKNIKLAELTRPDKDYPASRPIIY